VKPAKACWQIMRDQHYGRIVVTTSSTGLYGNFGQANYGAAKLALVGLMNTLKIEGAKDNIRVNAICPVAATRMTQSLMPPPMLEMLKPEYVTPGVVYLASEEAPNGVILAAGAGVFSAVRLVETEGVNLGHNADADTVAANWAKISDFSTARHYETGMEQMQKIMSRLQEAPLAP
jgi:NAD(P)-dependent dehydrogenase (short-subunit alcohol dehydrogenase family)